MTAVNFSGPTASYQQIPLNIGVSTAEILTLACPHCANMLPVYAVKYAMKMKISKPMFCCECGEDLIGESAPWVSNIDAADMFVDDVDDVTLRAARERINRAVKAGDISTNGKAGRERRLNPDSFAAWRLKQRDANLDKLG